MLINVTGSAHRTHAPELGTLRLHLEFDGAEPSAPSGRLKDAMAELAAELEQLRGDGSSCVARTSLSAPGTRSWRPYVNGYQQEDPRYAAWADAEAEFSDAEALGRVAARWAGRQGWTLRSVDWTLAEETERALHDEATAEAVERAWHRAEVIARAAGLEEVRPVEIGDPSQSVGGIAPYAMARAAKAPGGDDGFSIDPAPIEVSAFVAARFEA